MYIILGYSPFMYIYIYIYTYISYITHLGYSPLHQSDFPALMAACLKIASPVLDADVKPRPLRDRMKFASSWHHWTMAEMETCGKATNAAKDGILLV